MAPVRRRPKSTLREHSPPVSSEGDTVQSIGRLYNVEDVDLMQMAQKIVESVTMSSPLSISSSQLTLASDLKAP